MTRPFSAARARNAGAEVLLRAHPKIAYLQFVDGDCEVVPGRVSSASKFMKANPQIAVVCGRRRERFPDRSIYNRLCDAEWATSIGQAESCGGDSFVRATAFLEVGGFNDDIIAGEEPEFCSRLRARKWQIWRLDQEMTIHDAAILRFSLWWRRAVPSGYGYAQVWRETRGSGSPLYHRQLCRTVGWAILPILLAVVLALVVSPMLLLLAPTIYAAQWTRLIVQGRREMIGMQRAALLVVGKFAQFRSATQFMSRLAAGRRGGAIFYQ